MKKVQIKNSSKKSLLLKEAEVADSFMLRLRGLLGRSHLEEETGLIIKPCNSVHMIGMRFSIDAIFVDHNHKVCKIIPEMKKMSISPIVKGADYVIEVPAGTAKRKNLEVNDIIELVRI